MIYSYITSWAKDKGWHDLERKNKIHTPKVVLDISEPADVKGGNGAPLFRQGWRGDGRNGLHLRLGSFLGGLKGSVLFNELADNGFKFLDLAFEPFHAPVIIGGTLRNSQDSRE